MSTSDFDAIDFIKPGALDGRHNDFYQYLRSHGPVWREACYGVVMVTGYDEVFDVYRRTDIFSNVNVVTGPTAPWPVPLEGDDISEIIEKYRDQIPFNDQLPSFDPPKHTNHRALLGRLITPKRLKENEEFMWKLADRQIDQLLQRREFEFIADYAEPFTFYVIADLLGVPEEQHEAYRKEVQLGEGRAAMMTEEGTVGHGSLDYLYERFTEFIADRRANPREDVMTQMAMATFPDGSLPEVEDIMRIAVNLFSAGGETTARLLGVMFQKMGEMPELQEQLRKDRDLLPNFVEECMRLDPPIQSTFKLARVATKIGDVPIEPGTTVMVIPAAANRDPNVFEDPDEFRLGRPNYRQHLGFGSGVHACAGAPLARAEAMVSANRLLDRMSDIRLSEKHHGPPGARHYERRDSFMLCGLETLYLEFDAAPSA